MVTINEAYQDLKILLTKIYDKKESANIAAFIIEKITGLNKIQKILSKQTVLNEAQTKLLFNYSEQLLKHKPVQYVLNEAWFAGIKLYVDENVLIPRPETEELVEWILLDTQSAIEKTESGINSLPFTILDIGTGSGCIAIALKKKLPTAEISACDISEAALKIALMNAASNEAYISFFKDDIIQPHDITNSKLYDIIVSNPPYILSSESFNMKPNVLTYEPHLALFVPGKESLLLYDCISNFAVHHLKKNGALYVEINESYGKEIVHLFSGKGFKSVEIKKDLQGKDRMIKAVL